MHRPTLAALALAVACATTPPAAPPGAPQDTAPPVTPSDDTAPPDTDDPGDTDTDGPGPGPEPQRFEHVCTGAASYVHTFPVRLAWGDTQPEIVRWSEGYDGHMYRAALVEVDADGWALARCDWLPPLNGAPGYFVTRRYLLVVQ